MKHFYFTLILLFSLTISNSQDDLAGEWYVHYISVDNEIRYSTIPNSNNTAIFSIGETIGLQGGVCDNGYSGNYEYISANTLKLLDFNVLGGYCDYELEQDYFLYPYWGVVGAFYDSENYSYEITGSGTNESLQVTNPNGNYAVYGRTPIDQPEILGEWFLHSMTSNDVGYPNIHSSNFNINFTLNPDFVIGLSLDGIGVCNDYSGGYFMTGQNTLEIPEITVTLAGCDPPEAYAYEIFYFSSLLNNSTQDNSKFTVSIVENDIGFLLELYNIDTEVSGFYGRQPLSINELKKRQISLTQNPVNTHLEINGLTQTDLPYSIYTIDGKIVLNGVLNTNRIDVQVLTSGLYFLKVGEKHTIKFIKM